jgi:hypothetical protein
MRNKDVTAVVMLLIEHGPQFAFLYSSAIEGSKDIICASCTPQLLRAFALAASPPDCVYAGIVEAPQATAEPLNLSILVPAARARRLVRRVKVTTREANAERADHCCGTPPALNGRFNDGE